MYDIGGYDKHSYNQRFEAHISKISFKSGLIIRKEKNKKMKPQDKKIKKLVEEIGHDVGQFLQAEEMLGNQCAWTDRMVEKIIEDAEKLKKTYESQFKED